MNFIVSLTAFCGKDETVPTEIERLYREHRAGLVRLVERELRDHHDAEDVVQTAFLDAQRALERGTIPRNPHAWLAAIALNAGRRLRRRRLNAQPLEEYAVQEASGVPEIRAALATLPKEQRAAVLYRDVVGLSYGETAQQMGTSVNAVTMLLHRGRKRLRQTLGVTAGGIGLWRWLKRVGMPQTAVAKGAAAVVVAGGVATTGAVAARAVAPIGTHMTAAAATTNSADVVRADVLGLGSALRHREKARNSRVREVHASKQHSGGDANPTSLGTSTAETATSSLLPTVSVPALPIPTAPATVTISTPITTVSVTTPTLPTTTVTTPIATVTVPIP